MSSETKRLGKIVIIIVAVGAVAIAALAWYGMKLSSEDRTRRRVAANESAAILALDQIAAAEHLYFQTHGEYAAFPRLVEAGVFQAPLTGDALVADGYRFTLNVTPKRDGGSSSFSVSADPLNETGDDATGRRHFYAGSEVTGIRYSEGRPATANDKTLPRRSNAF